MLSREDRERLEEKERIDKWHDRIFAEGRKQERADVVAFCEHWERQTLSTLTASDRSLLESLAKVFRSGQHVGASKK